ncbi:MAG: hypothetical protein IT328_23980 [Caldilineaceae bacterium]|nr:hypothetical protein [Caldilineaceae bacterium]
MITVALLDALDNFLDVVRDSRIVATSGSDELGDAYWQARKWVDAWRNYVQPPAIYPEPAPVENCPHPYDRDFAFLNHDPIEDAWYVTRCCTVCGNVDPPHRLSPKKSKRKPTKKENQESL